MNPIEIDRSKNTLTPSMIDKIIFKHGLFTDENDIKAFISEDLCDLTESYEKEYDAIVAIVKRVMFKERRYEGQASSSVSFVNSVLSKKK
jgi:hypothetical protein